MGTNRTTLGIRNMLDGELDRIVKRRESAATELRALHEALVEAKVGVLALRGIGVDENQTSQEAGLIHNQQKLDGEVRELIAELAGLFDEGKPEVGSAKIEILAEEHFTPDVLLHFAAKRIVPRLQGPFPDDQIGHWAERLADEIREVRRQQKEKSL